mmetsp:Transcript_87551/g.173748  ORF Transcript_87551/g.173748 Transcript_87551/m.173748 type:complete len:137 (-) Transcript_87551:166-576(-)
MQQLTASGQELPTNQAAGVEALKIASRSLGMQLAESPACIFTHARAVRLKRFLGNTWTTLGSATEAGQGAAASGRQQRKQKQQLHSSGHSFEQMTIPMDKHYHHQTEVNDTKVPFNRIHDTKVLAVLTSTTSQHHE